LSKIDEERRDRKQRRNSPTPSAMPVRDSAPSGSCHRAAIASEAEDFAVLGCADSARRASTLTAK